MLGGPTFWAGRSFGTLCFAWLSQILLKRGDRKKTTFSLEKPRTPQRKFNRFQSSALIAPTLPLRALPGRASQERRPRLGLLLTRAQEAAAPSFSTLVYASDSLENKFSRKQIRGGQTRVVLSGREAVAMPRGEGNQNHLARTEKEQAEIEAAEAIRQPGQPTRGFDGRRKTRGTRRKHREGEGEDDWGEGHIKEAARVSITCA